MVHTATHAENNMGSEVAIFSCSKDKKRPIRWSVLG